MWTYFIHFDSYDKCGKPLKGVLSDRGYTVNANSEQIVLP